MQRTTLPALVCLALLAPAAFGDNPRSALAPDAQAAVDRLDGKAMFAHMRFLADDLLEGRGTPSRGLDIAAEFIASQFRRSGLEAAGELAAKYVAAQFEALGLQPGGANGGYFQVVPLREISVDSQRCEMSLVRDGSNMRLEWGKDFLMRGDALDQDAQVEAPVVFVGYGVVAPEQHYDDYAGIDVRGKIVAVLAGAPPTFPTDPRAHHSSGRLKSRAASQHGAVGVISLTTPDVLKSLPWERIVIGANFPSMYWLDPSGAPNDHFPQLKVYASLSLPAVERLFDGVSGIWAKVWADAQAGRAKPFALPFVARLHAVSRHRNASSPNVAAVLPGSDPQLRNEFVVYTAHTDHLGIGTPIAGDAIYNGAADNASGTAALMALAEAFSRLPKPPARSVMFLAVTAEEKGLLGSDYFAHFPTVPARSMVANMNMDLAGIFYEFKDVIVPGAEHSSLGGVAQRNAALLGLDAVPDPMPEQVFFIRSDQYSFVRAGIPAIAIWAGFTARDPKVDGRKFFDDWIAKRYHAPSDDMDQPMDLRAATQYLRLNFLVGYEVAQQRQRPTWNPGDFFGDMFGSK